MGGREGAEEADENAARASGTRLYKVSLSVYMHVNDYLGIKDTILSLVVFIIIDSSKRVYIYYR